MLKQCISWTTIQLLGNGTRALCTSTLPPVPAHLLPLLRLGRPLLAGGRADLARHRPLALAHHDEVLLTQLLLVRQPPRVPLVLPPRLLAPREHVHDAVYLGRLLRTRLGSQRQGVHSVLADHCPLLRIVLVRLLSLALQQLRAVRDQQRLLAAEAWVHRPLRLGRTQLRQQLEVLAGQHAARVQSAADAGQLLGTTHDRVLFRDGLCLHLHLLLLFLPILLHRATPSTSSR
mmetsp:Transcript_14127/g.31734  ORF Transcript_14127/g.31734 Transcript_14127/m.31734 type:complete len:232 (-) Transcript_14127:303-998(-)